MRIRLTATFFGLALAAAPTVADADEWIATKLRGAVHTRQNGQWTQLHRDDVISDSRVIWSGPDGAAQFTRNAETVDIGPNTQIRIFDRAGKPFTTVNESFGSVSIEANVKNVKHFAVQTPFIAAVVKGTKFEVTSDQANTRVQVTRGRVGVEDLHSHNTVDVLVNQHASAGFNQPLNVAGVGRLHPIKNKKGQIVLGQPGATESRPEAAAVALQSSGDNTAAASPSPLQSHSSPPSPTPNPTPTPTPTRTPAPTPTPTPTPPPSAPPGSPGGEGHHRGWWHGAGNPRGS